MSLDRIELLAEVEIYNPSDYAFSLPSLSWQLSIENRELLSGEHQRPIEIEAQQKVLAELPVQVPFDTDLSVFRDSSTENELQYRLTSQAVVGHPKLPTELRLSGEDTGSFPLVRPPEIRVDKLTIRSFSSSHIDFELSVLVRNPNIFSLELEELEYRIAVDETNWISGKKNEQWLLSPKQHGSFTLPMRFSFREAGRQTVDLLMGGKEFVYQLQGSSGFQIHWREKSFGPFHVGINIEEEAMIIRPDFFGL